MKTLTTPTHIKVRNGHHQHQHSHCSSTNVNTNKMAKKPLMPSCSGGKAAMLSEVHDHEVLRLPDIHAPGKVTGVATSPSLQRSGRSSTSFQLTTKPDPLLRPLAEPERRRSRSLLDIREESIDSESSFTINLDQRAEKSETSCARQETVIPKNTKKLLSNREYQQTSSFRVSPNVCTTRTQVVSFNKATRPLNPQNDFEEIIRLPDTTSTITSSSFYNIREVSKKGSLRRDNDNHNKNYHPLHLPHGTPPNTKNIKSSGAITRTRSFSLLSSVPRIPSLLCRTKSNSQPDMTECSSSSSESTRNLAEARKRGIRNMWLKAGARLGLRQAAKNIDPEALITTLGDSTWMQGPGNLLRPLYTRWAERRHALADPERMCMSQEVRERIEKDVHCRKRSLKRRMSNFLTVKLNLNMEEDLVA